MAHTASDTREALATLRRLRNACIPFVDRCALDRPDFSLKEIEALGRAYAEATAILSWDASPQGGVETGYDQP